LATRLAVADGFEAVFPLNDAIGLEPPFDSEIENPAVVAADLPMKNLY
jgi:hypothetical protein